MSCDASTQQGWLELAGPIQHSELESIKETGLFPLSFSFASRTTPPMLYNGSPYINEGPSNTCTYLGKSYSLIEARFAPSLHRGFNLPGDHQRTEAECILTFHREGEPISGILLCFPIYLSGDPSYSEYIEQLVRAPDPSGNTPVYGLDRLLYKADGSTTHTVLTYQPCFEILPEDNRPASTRKMYVFVFPKGIQLSPTVAESLFSHTRMGRIRPYGVPLAIRNFQPTLFRYQLSEGKKKELERSYEGYLYTNTISTCTTEFKRLMEYLVLPPRPKGGARGPTGQKQYTTEQYKCVPFHSLTDLSGNIVIPGNTTLQEVLDKKKEQESRAQGPQPSIPSTSGLSAGELEAIVGGSIGGILLLVVGYVAVTRLFTRPK